MSTTTTQITPQNKPAIRPSISLFHEQEVIAKEIVTNVLSGEHMVSMGGYAGTGKSVTAAEIIRRLESHKLRVVTACPTGKAANVQRLKGVNADTIHAIIYDFNGIHKKDGKETPIFSNKLDILKSPDVIVVDEASMVNTKMYHDIKEHGIRIIFVGDHGQLAPVGGDPGIMSNPQYKLETIRRQEEGSDIITCAHTVRQGGQPVSSDNVTVIPKVRDFRSFISKYDFDQAISGYNKTRHAFNYVYRKYKGYKKQFVKGEKIICLHNNRRSGVYNGMQFIVNDFFSFKDGLVECEITEIGNEKFTKIVKIPIAGMEGGKVDKELEMKKEGNVMIADYGYCITCHKSQGSEWDKVAVIAETKMFDRNRWLYTAVTRAKNELIIMT